MAAESLKPQANFTPTEEKRIQIARTANRLLRGLYATGEIGDDGRAVLRDGVTHDMGLTELIEKVRGEDQETRNEFKKTLYSKIMSDVGDGNGVWYSPVFEAVTGERKTRFSFDKGERDAIISELGRYIDEALESVTGNDSSDSDEPAPSQTTEDRVRDVMGKYSDDDFGLSDDGWGVTDPRNKS
jgi:hypothetical protein